VADGIDGYEETAMDSDWLWVMLALGIFFPVGMVPLTWHAMLAVGGASSAVNGVSARSRNLTYEQISSHRKEAVIGPQRS
jgi:hypothetical protein